MLYVFRQEVVKHMQQTGVIEPCSSPWASPVTIVCKDGSLTDFRLLNAVTKPHMYLLSRIVDLLNLLGKSTYLSTPDLVSGYWYTPTL